jgi:hypothetical protein
MRKEFKAASNSDAWGQANSWIMSRGSSIAVSSSYIFELKQVVPGVYPPKNQGEWTVAVVYEELVGLRPSAVRSLQPMSRMAQSAR